MQFLVLLRALFGHSYSTLYLQVLFIFFPWKGARHAYINIIKNRKKPPEWVVQCNHTFLHCVLKWKCSWVEVSCKIHAFLHWFKEPYHFPFDFFAYITSLGLPFFTYQKFGAVHGSDCVPVCMQQERLLRSRARHALLVCTLRCQNRYVCFFYWYCQKLPTAIPTSSQLEFILLYDLFSDVIAFMCVCICIHHRSY